MAKAVRERSDDRDAEPADDPRARKDEPPLLPELPPALLAGATTFKDELGVEEAGRRQGEAGLPRWDDYNLDEPQIRIVQHVAAQVGAATAALHEILDRAFRSLAAEVQPIDPERVTVQAETEKRKLLLPGQTIEEVSRRMISSENEYHTFRRENRIEREARYRESPYLFFAILFGLLVVEAFANAILLRHISSQGWVGGVFIASFISLVNVMLGVLGGAVGWRLAGHAHLPLRLAGIFIAIFTAVLALLWNVYVAHFREAAEMAVNEGRAGSGVLQGALDVMGHIERTGIFGLSSILSWLLFGIGIFVFLLVCRESWEDMADRYWDYKRVDQAFRETEGEYMDVLDGFRGNVEARFGDITKDVMTQAEASDGHFKQAEKIAALAEQRFEETQALQTRWAQEGANALRLYRETNARFRARNADRPPPYWDRFPSLSDYREGRVNGFDDDTRSQYQSRWRALERRLDDIRLRLADLRDQQRDNKRSLREIESRLNRMRESLPNDIEDFRRQLEHQNRRRLRDSAKASLGDDDGAV
jgi:hypothetical protein